MVELVQNVVKIDEDSNGDIDTIEPALKELADFVSSHMNTTMEAPVQLQYRYNTVVDQIVKEKEAEDTAYRKSVYDKAQAKCQAVLLYIRVPCVQEYVSSQPGVEPITLPPVEQFSYEYASPLWSPDLAGFSVLISVILGISTLYIGLIDYGLPKLVSIVKNDPLE